MNCPFLRETSVLGCRSAHVKKLIPRAGAVGQDSICLNEAHRRCPGFVDMGDSRQDLSGACPYHHESIAQYCAAAPVTKLIPYSEALLVRCGSGAFRYCDLFLEQTGTQDKGAAADDLPAPGELLYSSRHWWIDVPREGPWHAGLDAFSARLLGPVDSLSFIAASANSQPAVVLSVAGRDFTFIFPEDLPVSATNPQLRLHPNRIFDSPYTRGWIYEGSLTAAHREELRCRLLNAHSAHQRMLEDACLVNERLHHQGSRSSEYSGAALGDGGIFEAGLLAKLDRDSARALMHELASSPRSFERK